MSIQNLINRPCTIEHRSPGEEEDSYGNLIPKVEEIETVCELQQQSAYRQESEEEVGDTRWVLFLKPGTPIDVADTVTVEGRDYEVVGDPWDARNPRTGTASHIEVGLRRTAAMGDHS